MSSNKNSIIFLIFVSSSLVLGLIIGYLIGIGRLSNSQETIFNSLTLNNTGKTKVENSNVTAKEAYNIALGESHLWPEDARLSEIELISKKFDEKGFSGGWKITFYSKLKKKIFEVTVKDGESRGTIEKDDAGPVQTLKGEMIDSSVLAKSFFGSYSADTEIISLKMYYDFGVKKFLWTIFFPKGSHTIDAEM